MPNSSDTTQETTPFAVKDCALITIASGIKAQNLREFCSALQQISLGSIYHHFWGRLLRPLFDEPEYNNDFASWAHRALHDKPLAERLSMVIPTDFDNLEDLRQEMVEVVEEHLDESEFVPWAKADQQFHFLQSSTVIFDTGSRFDHPSEIVAELPNLSTGSIFYHFIDARSRTPERHDDFTAWLSGYENENGYNELCKMLCSVDPYFSSLKEIRLIVSNIFKKFFDKEN
jgi:hypothetical protein